MDTPEGISTILEQLDVKKNNVLNTLLTLNRRWKDMGDHLDTTKKHLSESFANLESKRGSLELIQESVSESSRELNEVRKTLQSHLEELKRREAKFHLFQKSKSDELAIKEEQLASITMEIEGRKEEVASMKNRLDNQNKSMQVLLEKIEMKIQEYVEIQASVGEKLNEIYVKMRSIKDRSKELDSIQVLTKKRAKEIDLREEELKIKAPKLASRDKAQKKQAEELKLKEKQQRLIDTVKRVRFLVENKNSSLLDDNDHEFRAKIAEAREHLQTLNVEPDAFSDEYYIKLAKYMFNLFYRKGRIDSLSFMRVPLDHPAYSDSTIPLLYPDVPLPPLVLSNIG